MNSAQRRLAVAALGFAFFAVGRAINARLGPPLTDGGWFNYAPNNGNAFSFGTGFIWRELLVWLFLIALWLGISMRILRDP